MDKGSNSVGRRGDPRMHRAVAARRANPSMSLLEALIVGGFKFSNGTDGRGKSDRNVYDSDNVLLCQRKNQLSRRLRLARRRSYEAKANVESFTRVNQSNEDFSKSAVSALERNPATKRGYDVAQSIDEQLAAASRLRASSDVNLETNSSLYLSTPPQVSLSALLQLQHQRALGQTAQTNLGTPSFFPHHQLGLNEPFLPNQIPPNLGLNGTNQSGNRSNIQNTTQNNLDQYLSKLAASSMGLGAQSILFPQQNIQTSPSQFLYQSILQNTHSNTDAESSAFITHKGDKNKQNVGSLHTQTASQLERAVEFFELERNALISRCLLLAGFGKHEVKSEKLLRDFEDMLKKKR